MRSDGYLSPLPLDPDLRSLTPADRVRPADESRSGVEVAAAWGGGVGAHAAVGRQRFFTPLRVVLAFAALFLCFGFFSKAPCLETTHPTDGSAPSLRWDGRQYYKACYSDPVPLYGAEGLADGHFPYDYHWVEGDGTVRYMEYPVVTGVYQYLTAQTAQAWEAISPHSPAEIVKYVVLIAIGMSMCWLVAVWATYKSAGRRPWDTLFMAACPLVVFQAFTNFDAIAVALACVGMMLWARNKPVWAGVALGIGVASKLYPLFLFGPLLVLAIRRRRFRELLVAAGAAAGAWLVVNLPIMVPFPEGWREFFRLNTDRPANPESIYAALRDLTGADFFDPSATGDTSTLNSVSLVIFLLCCVAVAVLGLRAKVTPRVAQLAFLVVAAFLVTNKVWSPQYSLWLVPLAVLAVPRARVLLPWMIVDALLWVAHMSYFQGPSNKGLDPEWFHSLVLVRDALVVAVCVVVVRQILHPAEDVVRMSHLGTAYGSDPLAGPLRDDAVDAAEAGAAGLAPVVDASSMLAIEGAGHRDGDGVGHGDRDEWAGHGGAAARSGSARVGRPDTP